MVAERVLPQIVSASPYFQLAAIPFLIIAWQRGHFLFQLQWCLIVVFTRQ